MVKERLLLQAELAEKARKLADNSHSNLISACQDVYVPRFLPGYQVIYIDDGDGDRVTDAQKEALAVVGLSLTLSDAMPDVLLW